MHFAAAALSAAGFLSLATGVSAATPDAGTISDGTRELAYGAGPFPVRNASAGAVVADEECVEPALPCDIYTLTIDLSDAYLAAHPDDIVVIQWRWPNAFEDYDFRIFDEAGAVVTTAGTASDPENAIIGAKNGTYTIRGVPFTVFGGSFEATLKLASPQEAPVPPAAPGPAPEYVAWGAPDEVDGNTGEPSIGFNRKTNRIMYLSGTVTLRTTYPELLDEPLPEVCDPLWEDVSFPYTGVITSDPILVTDEATGRTHVSQMHIPVPVPPTAVGLNSMYAYTDDDGDTWVPGQISPPEGGYDHQTVGSGPYPESLAVLRTPTNGGSAVYYCSQAGFTAFCARSDTGGLTFPTGFPIYNAQTDGFGGLHGHVKVAPDGTVYVPVKACGDQQCVTASDDGGVTWAVRRLMDSTPGASDPSLGIATDGTLYFCYVGGDGHPRAAVSHDKGLSWENTYDIGAAQHIVNAVFAQSVAGDPERASCAFIGTTQGGNFQALDFPGEWYGFVATTYDGGQNWHTVNVTPDAPVQRESGIWLGGGGAGQRNLLDFNEITTDAQGNALFAFADGCVGDCETGASNTFSAKASIARQIGGKPLFAANDPVLPAPPKAACLAGQRDQLAAHLSWRVPASMGSAISGYKVFRGSSDADEVLIGETGKARYDDFGADPAVESYRYRVVAVNAQGEGVHSNPVELPVVPIVEESSCVIPGITLYTDGSSDSTSNGVPGHELLFAALSEPKEMPGKLVLTMKVDSLDPQPPASTRWATYYDAPDGSGVRYVAMVTTDGMPSFEYGTKGSIEDTVGTYTPDGTPDETSSWSPDGTIAIVLDKATLGFVDGSTLTGLSTVVRTSSAADGAGVTADDAGTAEYQLRGTAACNVPSNPTQPPNQPPLGDGSEDAGRFGGALGWAMLAPLLLGGALRRRAVGVSRA
jgi:hypothetical protein